LKQEEGKQNRCEHLLHFHLRPELAEGPV